MIIIVLYKQRVKRSLVVVRGYCDGSRWRFDSSNARALWTVMQQRIFL